MDSFGFRTSKKRVIGVMPEGTPPEGLFEEKDDDDLQFWMARKRSQSCQTPIFFFFNLADHLLVNVLLNIDVFHSLEEGDPKNDFIITGIEGSLDPGEEVLISSDLVLPIPILDQSSFLGLSSSNTFGGVSSLFCLIRFFLLGYKTSCVLES